jgi:PAS domain S-box-containing protein
LAVKSHLDESGLRAVIDNLADAIVIADADGRYLDLNLAATRLLGYTRSEFLQLRVEDVVAREPAWTRAEYDQFVESGQWRGEIDLRRRDGSHVLVDANAVAISRPSGDIYVSVLRVAAERRQLEVERDRLAAIVESSNDAIIGKTWHHYQLEFRRGAVVRVPGSRGRRAADCGARSSRPSG